MMAVGLCNEHVRAVENLVELTAIQNTLDWSTVPKVFEHIYMCVFMVFCVCICPVCACVRVCCTCMYVCLCV